MQNQAAKERGDMERRSKELLRLEHQNTSISSLESALLVRSKDSSSITKKRPSDGTPITGPIPPSQLLGKVQDFLGLMSEANQQLELDIKDNRRSYDIEELTGNESQVIEMDLMLGVADLHTPEAVAAAESVISGAQAVIPLAADSSETDSGDGGSDDDNRDSESSDDEDEDEDEDEDDDDDGNDNDDTTTKSSSLVKRPISGQEKTSNQSKKRPKIVEL